MPGQESRRVAVVAIGGNSLIKDKTHQTVQDQNQAAMETSVHIAAMIAAGWQVVVTHGNGPQVGFILRRSELSRRELHEVPLDVCGADTQGAIGYMLQQNLYNEFVRRGMNDRAITLVTQVVVDPADPAFQTPSKPIGSFMDEADAAQRREEGWAVVEDAGRGWRRVVASPQPQRIVEIDAIRRLMADGFILIAVGGGGIPVVADADGKLHGVAAVIDKDLASARLATEIQADLFLISTAVDRVALNYKKPNQQNLARLTVSEARRYLAEGHFAAGSMGPKIEACLRFLDEGGAAALITNPESVEAALQGRSGTWITADSAAPDWVPAADLEDVEA
ncbi:MAG: carbamate kinase [Anaerolineae bacterium]